MADADKLEEGASVSPKESKPLLGRDDHHGRESARLAKQAKERETHGFGARVLGSYWTGASPYAGVTLMALSSLSYSFMGLFVKILAVNDIPSFETVAIRSSVISLLAGGSLLRDGYPLLGQPQNRSLVMWRSVIGFFALSCFFYSIQALPLRDATVLNFTSPIFTAMLASVFLKEKWGAREMAGTFCGFMGVLLVTQPAMIFGPGASDGAGAASTNNESYDAFAIFMALMGALLGGLAYVIVRKAGTNGEDPLVIVFAFAFLSLPCSVVGMLMLQHFVMPTPLDILGLIGVGVTAFCAQVFLTRGLQLEKAGRATSIQYVKVLGTYLLGVTFLHEVPSLLGALGALLIASASLFIAMDKKG
eukprot:jgi/Mesvir1/23732/Mv18673-RA.1